MEIELIGGTDIRASYTLIIMLFIIRVRQNMVIILLQDSTENIPIFVPTYEYERPRQRKFFRPFENPWYTATPHHLRKRQSNFDPWYDQQFLANRNTRARGHAYAPIGKQSGGGQKMFEGGGPKSFRRFSKRSTVQNFSYKTSLVPFAFFTALLLRAKCTVFRSIHAPSFCNKYDTSNYITVIFLIYACFTTHMSPESITLMFQLLSKNKSLQS